MTARTTHRRKRSLLVAVVLLLSACASGTSAEADVAAPQIVYTGDTVAGGQIDFGDLAGQDAVLWFWAPW